MLRLNLTFLFILGTWVSLLAQGQSHPALEALPSAESIESWLSAPMMRWGIGALIAFALLSWAAFLSCSIPLCRAALTRKVNRGLRRMKHPGLEPRFRAPRVNLGVPGMNSVVPHLQAASHSLKSSEREEGPGPRATE